MPSVKIQDKRDTLGINERLMRIRQKKIVLYSSFLRDKSAVEVQGLDYCDFRERRSSFSLDLRPFGRSVLDGARSKVYLRGEGYAWTPIWWSFNNSKR